MKKKLIYDTDLIGDDLLTLFAIANSKEYELKAITPYGRRISSLERGKIAKKLIDEIGLKNVKIYPGVSEPLVQKKIIGCRKCDDSIEEFYNKTTSKVTTNTIVTDKIAPLYLMEIVKKHPKEYTVLGTGPLTNIALAIKLDPNFGKNLKELVIMGGAYRCQGNVSPFAESNMFNDPEAARIVFSNISNIRIVPLDVTKQVNIDVDYTKKLANDDVGNLISSIIKSCCKAHITMDGKPLMPLHDILAYYVLEEPNIVNFEKVHLSVETQNFEQRGKLIEDESYNIQNIGTKVNIDLMLSKFTELIQSSFWINNQR
ncbi:MAG: nucleoside hydrolase [Sphaerochaetaceae bacterium]